MCYPNSAPQFTNLSRPQDHRSPSPSLPCDCPKVGDPRHQVTPTLDHVINSRSVPVSISLHRSVPLISTPRAYHTIPCLLLSLLYCRKTELRHPFPQLSLGLPTGRWHRVNGLSSGVPAPGANEACELSRSRAFVVSALRTRLHPNFACHMRKGTVRGLRKNTV